MRLDAATILVVASHPDDEILGAGGLMATYPGVKIAIVSEGTSNQFVGGFTERMAEKRAAAREASKVLQSKIVGEGFFPDQQLKLSPTLVQWIENIVSTNNPTVVLTHCPTDLNMDHRVVAEAVMLATRPFSKSGKLVSWVLGFTVDVDHLPALNLVTKVVLPLTEAALALKLKALRCYGNEMRAWPHPRSYEALEHHMRWFGSTIGYPAGEPYMVIRGILR